MSRQLPTLKPREVIRALERAGLRLRRAKGSHHYFQHPGRPELLVCVPVHPGALKRPDLRAILRQDDLTVEKGRRCLVSLDYPLGAGDTFPGRAGPRRGPTFYKKGFDDGWDAARDKARELMGENPTSTDKFS
jgi:predicted RNA binding protein YcfA (HicA-like mRNA interferase family)